MEKYLMTKILKTTKPFTGRVKVTAEWVFRLTYVFYVEIVHLLFQQRFSIDRYRDRRVTKIEPFSLSWSSCYVAGYSLRASQTIDLKNRKTRTYFSGLNSDPYFPKKKWFICFNESPLKMMKNAFYFILKALFVLKIFQFLSQPFGHVEKWLD